MRVQPARRSFLAPASLAGLLAVLAGCANGEPAPGDPFSGTGEMVALSGAGSGASNACFTCHGLDGGGNGDGVPRLAGLGAGYLHAQMIAYADGRRHHPEMNHIAGKLEPGELRAVAHYYAGLVPPLAPPEAATASFPGGRGAALYHSGDPARGLPPCAACHGAQGQGLGPANPPLAGQPAPYLAEQHRSWLAGERRNDPQNVMLRITRRLTPGEIRAVSAYAAALPVPARRRESPGAFP